MKKIFVISACLLLPLLHYAQDTIFKRNAEKIVVKVLEVSPDEIKYKKFNYIDGPTYIEKKAGIRMIVYSNGTRELFEAEVLKIAAPAYENDYYSATSFKADKIEDLKTRYHYKNRNIGQREMQKIVMGTGDKEIKLLVAQSRESKRIQLIGFATIPFGIAAFYSMVYSTTINNNSGALAAGGICIAGTIACPIISGIHRKKKENFNSRAIAIYNQKY